MPEGRDRGRAGEEESDPCLPAQGGREGGGREGKTPPYLDSLDRTLEVSGNWLLAEDMLACCRAFFDLVGVELGGGADPNGLDVRVVDDLGRKREREGGREGGKEERGWKRQCERSGVCFDGCTTVDSHHGFKREREGDRRSIKRGGGKREGGREGGRTSSPFKV